MVGYGEEEKKGISAGVIILIVVGAVVVLAVAGVLVMGVTFLWAQSFTEDFGDEVSTLKVRGTIDGTEDTLEMEVLSGTVDWYDFKVLADGQELITLDTSSSAGETALFSGLLWDPEPGSSYQIRIVDIEQNALVWEQDIIASA